MIEFSTIGVTEIVVKQTTVQQAGYPPVTVSTVNKTDDEIAAEVQIALQKQIA